jgi:hypothetical protein
MSAVLGLITLMACSRLDLFCQCKYTRVLYYLLFKNQEMYLTSQKFVSELVTGRVHPRVGSGWVGSGHQFSISTRVGSGVGSRHQRVGSGPKNWTRDQLWFVLGKGHGSKSHFLFVWKV